MAHLRSAEAAVDDDQVDAAHDPVWDLDVEVSTAGRAKRAQRTVEAAHLRPVDALLRRAEQARPEAADLDHDQRGRRPGIQGQQVDLVTTDTQVAGQDPPASGAQPIGDQ
jgi:hypothetical protein